MVGVTGHSLGGAVSVLTAIYPTPDPRIKAIAPIAGRKIGVT
jgi:dienelactone hydrolase